MVISHEDLIKEMFAQFGATYYHSEVMCRGLGIYYALMSFRDSTDVTKPRVEEKLVEVFSLTLGLVIPKVKASVDTELGKLLEDALKKRNFLAHEFWYERAYAMQHMPGLMSMITELREYQELFSKIDNTITALTVQRRTEFGITDQLVEEQLQRGMRGEQEQPLPEKKPLSKSMLRIVAAYDVVLEDKVSTLVFLTEDNQYLQFCDIGLGWSPFTETGSHWTPNPSLQNYLPASVVPRPEITTAWNYEFKLPKNAVLWVKKGSADKTFRWGIKTNKSH